MLPKADDDRLLLLVFGPGTGELVMLRAPGAGWLVIDGCSRERKSYAQQALAHYQERPEVVVLTHPHEDHAGGLARLIDDVARTGEESSWPLLGMVEPLTTSVAPADPGSAAAKRRGQAEGAVAAILDRWERARMCAWRMQRGDTRAIGAVTLTVLSPATPQRQAMSVGGRVDENSLASALQVDWHGVRLVLGADLEPARHWVDVLQASPGASAHHALKVPHHGSVAALHVPLLTPSPTAHRIVTPFASQRLPRFEATGGVNELQRTAPDVHLTALPRPYAKQGGAGARIPRTQLAAQPELQLDPKVAGFPDCFVAIEWTKDGGTRPTRSRG
jgi:hypothetical protein